MTKKMQPMSLSISPEMKEILDTKAEAKGQKTSDFIRRLLGYFSLERDDIKPVVLQIPQEAMASREDLAQWLDQKSVALLNQFFPEAPKSHHTLPPV
jgi:hypothetical protein